MEGDILLRFDASGSLEIEDDSGSISFAMILKSFVLWGTGIRVTSAFVCGKMNSGPNRLPLLFGCLSKDSVVTFSTFSHN